MRLRSRNKKYNKINRTTCGKCTGRHPVIRLNHKTIKYAHKFKLLGLHYEEKLVIQAYWESLSETLRSVFHKLARLVGSKWVLNSKTLKTIY